MSGSVDWDSLATQIQANFAATGQWFVGGSSPPSPAPPAEVDWNTLAAGVLANFTATGRWFLGGLPSPLPPPPLQVDWNALAAEVQANFAATGTWFAGPVRPGDPGGGEPPPPSEPAPPRQDTSLFFIVNAGDGAGTQIWFIDLATGTAHPLTEDLAPTLNPADLRAVGEDLYFNGSDGEDVELFRLHLDAPSDAPLKIDVNPNGSSFPGQLTEAGGRLFFSARSEPGFVPGRFDRTDLWSLDPDSPTPAPVKIPLTPDFPSNPRALTEFAGDLYLLGERQGDTAIIPNLWTLDPASPSAAPAVVGAGLGGLAGGSPLVAGTDRLYFTGVAGAEEDLELWIIDRASPASPLKVDINPVGSSIPFEMTEVGSRLYFSANEGPFANAPEDRELWSIDLGAPLDPPLKVAINPVDSSFPSGMTRAGNRL